MNAVIDNLKSNGLTETTRVENGSIDVQGAQPLTFLSHGESLASNLCILETFPAQS